MHVCVPQWGAHCCKEAYSNLDRQLQSIPVEYYMQAVKELDKEREDIKKKGLKHHQWPEEAAVFIIMKMIVRMVVPRERRQDY